MLCGIRPSSAHETAARPTPNPLPAAAWDKVDGVLAKFFGLDECKYQWAIDQLRMQQNQKFYS